jgi:hypothetical protein
MFLEKWVMGSWTFRLAAMASVTLDRFKPGYIVTGRQVFLLADILLGGRIDERSIVLMDAV